MPDVLVLSHSFEPIDIVDWERAITLDYEGKTETIEVYAGSLVRSPSIQMEVPAVIRFKLPHTKRRQVVRYSREGVYDRDQGLCAYCNTAIPYKEMTIDHVIPRARGGQTKWDNVVASCSTCNTRKGQRTLAESGMRLRTIPHKPKSLPRNSRRNRFIFRDGMPSEWRAWLPEQ